MPAKRSCGERRTQSVFACREQRQGWRHSARHGKACSRESARVLRVIVRQGVLHERNENPTRKTTTGRKGTTTRINKRGGTSCGGIDPRNHIWEVRSKASTPEITKKPFKALLHRKADKVRRFFKTALASIEASSIFDLDERACFNYLISKYSGNSPLSKVANIKQFVLNFSYLQVICW